METDQFLTDAELERLTGYRSPKKQAAHCRKIGIPFFPNARGKPIVSRDVINGTEKAAKPKAEKPAWQPAVLKQ